MTIGRVFWQVMVGFPSVPAPAFATVFATLALADQLKIFTSIVPKHYGRNFSKALNTETA
ncbi:MAG: hypothetical protein WD046_00670 [Paracoccaceae bacterium]